MQKFLLGTRLKLILFLYLSIISIFSFLILLIIKVKDFGSMILPTDKEGFQISWK